MTELIPMITERQGQPVTTSRAVAEQFGKQHAHVLRDIENLIRELTNPKMERLKGDESKIGCISEGAEFVHNNFIVSSYRDSMKREKPMYLLTRDGFTLLAMGFTGAKALQFKVAYIDAFNRMERIIRNGTSAAAQADFESRLKALERTAGKAKYDAMSNTAISFLQALQDALDSGEYRLIYAYRKDEHPAGKVLGIIHRDYIAVSAAMAYELYAGKMDAPAKRSALWEILAQEGVIDMEFKGRGQTCVKGKKMRAVYLKTGMLKNKERDQDNG